MRSRTRSIRSIAVGLALIAAPALYSQDHVFISPRPAEASDVLTPKAASGPCSLTPAVPTYLTEGPTDPVLHAPSIGTLRAVMLFVDFPDAVANETTPALFDRAVTAGRRWFAETSNGRFNVDVTPVHRWYRMPLPSSAYGLNNSLAFDLMHRYMSDAISLANAEIDFSNYDAVFVISSAGAQLPRSPTFLGYPGDGVPVDGKDMRWGIAFGNDLREPQFGEHILIHEVQHILGLPDLYLFSQPYPDFLRPAGGWDVMSLIRTAPHNLAWHKWKLGWLDTSAIHCASSTAEVVLTPLSSPSGTKAIVVKKDSDTALVAELRRPVGEEARLCDSGLLVYTVEASVAHGSGPIQVHSAGTGEDVDTIFRCGPKYNATFDLRAGKHSRYSDGEVAFEIVRASAQEMVVRVVFQPEAASRRRPARR